MIPYLYQVTANISVDIWIVPTKINFEGLVEMETLLKMIMRLCPSQNYSDLASVYFTAKLIIAYTTDGNYSTAISSAQLQRALYSYKDVISSALNDEHTDTWCDLCHKLQQTGLDQDYRGFFQIVIPFGVQDWATFCNHWAVGDVGKMLVALCVILRDTPPDSLELSANWLHDQYTKNQYLLKKIGLDFDTYAQCWRAVHLTDLASSNHTSSGSVSSAVKLYHSMQLPITDLLSDYAAIYLDQGEMARHIAIRGNRKRNRATPVAEHGRSERDLELERTLLSLSQEIPTDVIRGLFYPTARNDAGFECTYLMRHFDAAGIPNERVLIVNPSPDMVLCIAKKAFAWKNYSFFVGDKTLASLYTKQFGQEYTFLTDDMLENRGCQYDRILITSRDKSLDPLLVCLQWSAPNACVTALIPEVSLSVMYEQLQTRKMGIHTVLSVPGNATQSSPRKKVLIEARTDWTANGCLIHRGICDEYKTLFGIRKHCFWAPYTWLTSKMTIADMRKAVDSKPATRRVNDPLAIRYSPEITLHLTIQANRKGKYAGRLCYRRILRPEDKHRKRGDKLTPVVEKGLRHNTEEEVIAATERVVLDERLAPAIVEDVLDAYKGRLQQMSFKTAWFCLRSKLLTKYGYHEDLVLELFSRGDDLVLLQISTNNPVAYEDAMANLFEGKDAIPKKYWDQILLILNAAKDTGFIEHNMLSHYIVNVTNRMTKRQQEVRNALVKKTFKAEEEKLLLNDALNQKQDYSAWMETNPRYIALPLAAMAVPDIREAVAVRWMDLVHNNNLGSYHIQIVQYVADDGVARPVFDRKPERRRCVPVAMPLAKLLLLYKDFLRKRYDITDEQLAMVPIILEDHRKLKRGSNIKLCAPSTISKMIRKHIDNLDIHFHAVVLPDDGGKLLDLNSYGGNILLSHLRYRLRHLCKFTEGEICYFLGLKAPDTFSAHYCAYDHPVLQHRMVCKLNRWIGVLTSFDEDGSSFKYDEKDISGEETLLISGFPCGVIHCDVTIIPAEGHMMESMSVQMSSNYGLEGSIVVIKNK